MAYPSCKHLKRTQPSFEVDKEKAEAISKSFRVLPVFETALFEDVYRRHYSLESNEFLRCRWEEFKANCASRVHQPFQFYDQRDLHFYLNTCRLIPSQSVHNKTQFRKSMNSGIIVDSHGPKPIAQEMHVRQGTHLFRKFPKRYPKNAEEKKDK